MRDRCSACHQTDTPLVSYPKAKQIRLCPACIRDGAVVIPLPATDPAQRHRLAIRIPPAHQPPLWRTVEL